MQNIKKLGLKRLQVKGFTLIESLLVLLVVSFVLSGLSSSVSYLYQKTQESLFFSSFESLYRHAQRYSASGQKNDTIRVSQNQVSSQIQQLQMPKTIQAVKDYTIALDSSGGNSSLQKIQFRCGDRTVSYQLYIGSGRYKKTEG